MIALLSLLTKLFFTPPKLISPEVSPNYKGPQIDIIATKDIQVTFELIDSIIYPNNQFLGESYSGNPYDKKNYYQLYVTSIRNNKRWKVLSGDFRISDWKWTNDNQIKISYNCGTACRSTKIIKPHDSIVVGEYGKPISKENGWHTRIFPPYISNPLVL